MKIFISWSGDKSKAVAEALHPWLRRVIHQSDPWISSRDIEQGARWSDELSHQLQEACIGIIILTRENISAPWMLFEAGALAKTLKRTFVCPYLLDLTYSELQGPLAQFQASKANETDTRKLVQTINKALGNVLTEPVLNDSFNVWWPKLKESLDNITKSDPLPEKPLRQERDILEEILQLTRQQTRDAVGIQENESRRVPLYKNLLADYRNDKEVLSFAAKIHLKGEDIDPNAINWTENAIDDGRGDWIEGNWFSRWNSCDGKGTWINGSASIMSIDHRIVILYKDGHKEGLRTYASLIIAQKEGNDLLIGRYYDFSGSNDSGPWVGFSVNSNRIDGQWSHGRWDFRRNASDAKCYECES